jgi:hypothetical protein
MWEKLLLAATLTLVLSLFAEMSISHNQASNDSGSQDKPTLTLTRLHN